MPSSVPSPVRRISSVAVTALRLRTLSRRRSPRHSSDGATSRTCPTRPGYVRRMVINECLTTRRRWRRHNESRSPMVEGHVGGGPDLVRNAVHTGTLRRRRHRSAVVGAAVAASLGLVLAVPMVQSALAPDQRVSSATAPVPALPQIATSSYRWPAGGLQALLKGRLTLSTDGHCLAVGKTELVWPKGYRVALRNGQVTVLDDAGAQVARVGDVIQAGGGLGDAPADGCGLGSKTAPPFSIHSKVSRTLG